MLLLSNVASLANAYFNNRTVNLSDRPVDQIDFDEVKESINFQLLTSCLMYLLLDLAFWVFSFRYWKISFVIPM